MLYQSFLKPLLFKMDPESAHEWAASLLASPLVHPLQRVYRGIWDRDFPELACQIGGLPINHPIGLAAGFDKNAIMVRGLAQCGFAFMEVGTVTGQAQPGNPKPRLFRLPSDAALINRMGFNNQGCEAVAERLATLRKKPLPLPIGGNIGKSKVVPNEQAVEDYLKSFRQLMPFVDFFVVNVSSPNTPNLRALQDKGPLLELLTQLQAEQKNNPKPLWLKIAPDLNPSQLEDIVDVAHSCQLSGVIATNTTIERSGLSTPMAQVEAMGAGGLSGKPLKQRATEVIRFLRQHLAHDQAIIGVGGIETGQDVFEKLQAGASAVQVYTGFIYGGPDFVFRLKKQLLDQLHAHGMQNLGDLGPWIQTAKV